MGKIFASQSLLRTLSILGVVLLFLTHWLGQGGLLLLLAAIALLAGGEYACRFFSRPAFSPYLFMILSPLLLLHYSSIGDFRIRLAGFIMLAYIISLARYRPACRGQALLSRIRPWQAWMASWLVLAAAAVLLHSRGIQLSGDEPHYIMIAQSIVEDGDLDLKNNIRDKTYFAYLPVEIRFHGAVHDGRHRSFHMPGLSFLLLPFVHLFRLLDGAVPASLYFRLVSALFNSFFALGLFLALQRVLPEKLGQGSFLFFLTSFPLVFHAVHLFPELPAAALMIFAYLLGRDHKRFFAPGLLLAAVPWLHLKYGIPAMILSLFLLARTWRGDAGIARHLKRTTLFLAPLATSMALLGLYSKILYGSFNPTVISPEKNFLAIPFHFRVETLLSFFLDQRDGLLVYAPVFLLVFLVFRRDIRRSIRDFPLLASILIFYVLFHAFTTVRGAYSPAARPTLFVMWIMAIFLSALYRESRPGLQAVFRLLSGLTVFATIWLAYYPLFLYQPVTRGVSQRSSSLLAFISSDVIDLPAFFPSFLKIQGNASWLPNWLWLGSILLALLVSGSRRLRPLWTRAAKPAAIFGSLGLLLLFSFLPHVRLQTRYGVSGLSFYCNSRNFSYRPASGDFRIQAGNHYDLFFDLKGSAAHELHLSFSNGQDTALTLRNGKRKLQESRGFTSAGIDLPLRRMDRFHLGRRELVHIGLQTDALRDNAAFLLKLR